MPTLPQPRGTLSEQLIGALTGSPSALDSLTFDAGEPLLDEDLQLSLYVCYELAYRSFECVDPSWEWNPPLIAFRTELERRFESALQEALGPADGSPMPPGGMDIELRRVAESDDGPSLSQYIERDATEEQLLEFLIH